MATDYSDLITRSAQKYGIDPRTALRVARSEGGTSGWIRSRYSKGGYQEPSYGPFQLLVGGEGTGFPRGMGNDFMDATGLDPRDPANADAAIDYAMSRAKQDGWGAWYGAAKSGIGRRDGIGTGGATGFDVASAGPSLNLPSAVPAPLFYDEAPAQLAKKSFNPFDLIVPSAAADEMPQDVISVPDVRTVQGDAPNPYAAKVDAARARKEQNITDLAAQVGRDAAARIPAAPEGLLSPGTGVRDVAMTGEVGTRPLPASATAPLPPNAPGAGIGRMGSVMQRGDPSNVLTPEQKSLAFNLGHTIGSTGIPDVTKDPALAGGPTGFNTTVDWTDTPGLSVAPGMQFADQTPLARLKMEDFSMDPNGPVLTDEGVQTHTPAPFPDDANNPATGGGVGAGSQLPNGANAPIPTPTQAPNDPATDKLVKGKFDMGNFLGALGSIMAALDQGSPELKSVSLDGYAHKPENTNIPLPKGLLG
jgi:hypothetical protein